MKPLAKALLLPLFFLARGAAAESACSTITRANVGPCAVEASLGVRAAALEVVARRASVERARIVLPSNPTLALSFAGRRSSDDSAFNAYAQLGQEVELGGQRSARVQEARARVASGESTRLAEVRDVASEALALYFELSAAREEVTLLRRIEALALRVAETARSQAKAGATSELEADVAEAQAQKRTQARLVAEGKSAAAEVRLARALGRRSLTVEGSLVPVPEAPRAVTSPRVDALRAEARALDAQATAASRARVPNVTVSLFAQSDGFHERVLGAGLSVPLPLPEPLGRSRTSDVEAARAEAEATRARAEAKRAEISREAEAQEVETAALIRAAASIDEARAARAEASLGRLAEEVEKGRLPARDAFVAQDALAEMLAQHISARRAACLASVRLAALRDAPLEIDAARTKGEAR